MNHFGRARRFLSSTTAERTFLEPLTDTLDLHGFTRSEAEPAVVAFLERNHKRNPGALVHIITGRGKGSRGLPALKPRVRTMLKSGTLPVDTWGTDLDDGGFLI